MLRILLIFYAAALFLNTGLSLLLWKTQKSSLFRDLAVVWACGFVAFVAMGLFQDTSLEVALTLLLVFPGALVQGRLIAKLSGFRLRWRELVWLVPVALAGTFAANAAGLSFAWVTMPAAIATGVPLLYPAMRVLFTRASRPPTCALFALAFTSLLSGLHQLDFPFLREVPGFAPYGFSFGMLLVFASSILAPVAALEGLKNRLLSQEHEALLATREAVRVRDEFLSIASHELRTPITLLKIQIQLLLRLHERGRDLERIRLPDLLRSSEKGIERLERLVSDLLDATRITENRLTLRSEEFDLVALVRDVLDQFAEALKDAGCSLALEAHEPVVGSWDRYRLEQVLMNLISNAIKYGPGRPICISVARNDGGVVLKVEDHGAGISPSDQSRLFGRFERASASPGVGGLGLGLYISRAIVDQHQGRISVASEPGSGSTFTVELPLRAAG